ncbi:MAG: aminoacyl-tRNA deacylase [Lactobacillus sp.]|jgi:Cys-tRNA(Pro)/Cys-tRNA(Cys) deacylase|nr:aminoacyl-tRNA deacylase [Lactobacillus sp.]
MSKKKSHLNKTLVEKILDKAKVAYKSYAFSTHQEGDVQQLNSDHAGIAEHKIYKTLVFTGHTTGPVVAVIPLDTQVDWKKLSKVSGNKKVGLVPLKDLMKTSGYEHGANTPIGIHETHNYPIFISDMAEAQPEIIVSAGKIGRSVGVNPKDLVNFLSSKFVDITE